MIKSFLFLAVLFAATLVYAATKKNAQRFVNIFPPKIKCIAIISPASHPNEKTIRQGAAMLETAGIKVKLMPHCFAGSGKTNAPLESRFSDWNAAVNDSEVDMIIPTRGGTGAEDLVKLVDWKNFKERNLILMEFSNITCITSAMDHHQAGHPIAGPNLGRLVTASQGALEHLKAVLAQDKIPSIPLTPLKQGNARGRIYAGHLVLLENNYQSSFPANTAGRVIFIECIGRDTQTLGKHFNSLLAMGFFKQAAAVVFCHFTGLADPQNLDRTLEMWAAQLPCPVYKGYPYGHTQDNYALDFSRTAVIKDNLLSFE